MLNASGSRTEVYDPLDYANLTRNIVRELMERGPFPLPPERFTGAGVYALFYDGELDFYQAVRSVDATRPIYVGKAVPKGARKGMATGAAAIGDELYGRLRQHARSIDDGANLKLSDFSCRFLVVEPLWITMAERFLIEHYQPLWNLCVEGFGIHNPGKGRYQGEIPWWDALHPGRPFAKNLRQTRSAKDAIKRVVDFLHLQADKPEAARTLAAEAAERAEITEEE